MRAASASSATFAAVASSGDVSRATGSFGVGEAAGFDGFPSTAYFAFGSHPGPSQASVPHASFTSALTFHASLTEVSLCATRCLSTSTRVCSAAMRNASACIRSASLSSRTRCLSARTLSTSCCVLEASRVVAVARTGSGEGEASSSFTSSLHSQRSAGQLEGVLLHSVSHHSTDIPASALHDFGPLATSARGAGLAAAVAALVVLSVSAMRCSSASARIASSCTRCASATSRVSSAFLSFS